MEKNDEDEDANKKSIGSVYLWMCVDSHDARGFSTDERYLCVCALLLAVI